MTDVPRPDAADADAAFERRLASLTPEKRALLEKKLLARRQGREEAPAITPRDFDGPAPLSFVQELMWLVHELDPGTHAYNSSGARRLRGTLDVGALERAINRVIERHSSLRTSFELRDGTPVQIINEGVSFELERVAAHGIDDAALTELLRGLVRRPFDLSVPLLIRSTLVEIGPTDHVLLTSANHIVWDGWSKGIYFREFAECYDAFCTGREPVLPELALQYADFAVWQRTWLSGERMQRQLDYWRQTLAGAPPLLDLPTDRPRPAVATHQGDRMEMWIEADVVTAMREVGRTNAATEFMMLVALWATFLHRFSGQTDIVLGTPIAGRNRAEVEGMIGYFNNTLALRIDCSGDPTFVELLGRVRETALSAYSHQDVSFEHVVREVAPQRDLSYSPLFQSLIVFQNAAKESSLELRDLEMDMIVTESGTAKFDLSLGVGEYDGRLHPSFEYASDLFDRETVARVVAMFARLVQEVVEDPARRLSEFALLSDAGRSAILEVAQGPVRPIPASCLHELFDERAAATPQAVAVSAADEELTYAQLRERSEALEAALRSRGVGVGDHVGFCLERTAQLIVAILGILRAGAACVPLDPAYPVDRLRAMVQDAGVRLVVADDPHAPLVQTLGVEPVSPRAAQQGDDRDPAAAGAPATAAGPDDAAYVIFTSGSTGRPKGVVLEHRGLVNHALAAIDLFGIEADERTLQFASISFDISLEEIFVTLLAGGTLVIRDEDMPLGGPGLVAWLERRAVTFLDLPTAFWHEWVRDLTDHGGRPPTTLRRLVVGGEKASAEAYATWRALAPSVRWINTYGPTETSVIVTAYEPPADWRHMSGVELPIGRPLPNVSAHVLDEHRRVVPDGVRGELYVGGVGVARGYLGLPDATAERFSTFEATGERVYRTGDIVRRLPDGTILYVGRTDGQIKLRGFRVEPGEVEAVLLEHPAVTAALVLLHEGAGDPALVAYVVGEGAADRVDPAELRRFAADRLPAFAVPSTVMALDAFPLTENGKVDRDALPPPAISPAGAVARSEPRNDTERVLVEIWSEVLRTEVGIDDDFFELGGHSMLAVRMLTQVEARLGERVRLAAMVRSPTIRGLAEGMAAPAATDKWRALVEMKPDGSRPPLFLIHSLTGDVLLYRDLVRRLVPEQPAWGLEAIGADGRQLPLLAIPDMARHYIEEMRSVQPQGPYHLAGLCYGGAVAHEMAHQLEQGGERVAFVGLIEAAPLGLRQKTTLPMRVGKHVHELRELAAGERVQFLRSTGLNVVDRVKKQARWRVKKHLYMERGRALPPGLTDMIELNFVAAVGYVSPQYGGRVTLFRVYDPAKGENVEDTRQRWREFAAGGLDVRNVISAGADRISVLFEPHVAALGAELEAALQEVLEEAAP